MDVYLIHLFLGFIEGFALILSPCILPILPVFFAVALTGSKKRPWGMLLGFTLFFAVLVFFSRQLVYYSGLNLEFIRNAAYVILIELGVIMMSNYLTEQFQWLVRDFTDAGAAFSSGSKEESGLFNGIWLGALIALIWIPCAGPILAAIIVQTVSQETTLLSFFTLLSFALGAVIPLLIISFYGKKILTIFKNQAILLRKVMGALLIVCVIYLAFFSDNVSTTTATPSGVKTSSTLIDGLWRPYPAPELEGISAWINSPPLQLHELRGKVVLVDFWTYSCINCLRTLPYYKEWYQKYHDEGLVIIGVHTPEFAFEQNLANVEAAVKRDGILYPVVLDNQFKTWDNFHNKYWPAHYLINKKGEVVYEHLGEGAYEVTENNIRFLLGMHEPAVLKTEKKSLFSSWQTPEIYLGYDHASLNTSPTFTKDKPFKYSFSDKLSDSSWELSGLWQVNADYILSKAPQAALKLDVNARKVFAVMGSTTGKPIAVTVFLNQTEVKTLYIDKYSLYEMLDQKQAAQGELELRVSESGLRIYTFTFGD